MASEVFLHARKRGQSIVENALLDDCKLTGMAKYLLIQFCSHRQGEWKINMKDIVKRSKNGRDAHYNALTELIHNKYVARIKVLLKGRHVEQVYVFGQIKLDVEEYMLEIVKQKESKGFSCRVEFGEPVTENTYVASEGSETSEKPHTEKPNMDEPNVGNQYNINNQGTNSQEKNINNNDIDNNDDDKRTPPSGGSAVHNDDNINLIISVLRESTKDDLSERSFKAVVRKVVDKYNQGKVGSFRDYLATSLANKIEQLELRRIKEQAKSAQREGNIKSGDKLYKEYIQMLDGVEQEPQRAERIPFYNWLED